MLEDNNTDPPPPFLFPFPFPSPLASRNPTDPPARCPLRSSSSALSRQVASLARVSFTHRGDAPPTLIDPARELRALASAVRLRMRVAKPGDHRRGGETCARVGPPPGSVESSRCLGDLRACLLRPGSWPPLSSEETHHGRASLASPRLSGTQFGARVPGAPPLCCPRAPNQTPSRGVGQ